MDHETQTSQTNQEPYVHTWQAADAVGCCQQTLLRMAKAGRVPALKVGREYRFQLTKVMAALTI